MTTAADIVNLAAMPVAMVAMGAVGWAATRASTYLREKAHNERLARLTDALGRIAGDIAGKLQSMPAGSNLEAVKGLMVQAGVADAKAQFAQTITALGGATDTVVAAMISGEIGKLTAPAAAAALSAPLVAAAVAALPIPVRA